MAVYTGYEFPIYQPAMRTIASISNSNPVIIRTYIDHQYQDGLIVRINIPPAWGMIQLNQMFGPITVIDQTAFSMPINTINFDEFVFYIGNLPPQLPQAIPMGEINEIIYQATRNVLPYPAI